LPGSPCGKEETNPCRLASSWFILQDGLIHNAGRWGEPTLCANCACQSSHGAGARSRLGEFGRSCAASTPEFRLEPVMNFPAGGAGSQFFSVLAARSDEYGVSSSDERRRNGENWPQPSGFHPGLRRKSGDTSLSSSTVDPPQPSDSASSGPILVRNAAREKVHNGL
jgi:hypothetical protein